MILNPFLIIVKMTKFVGYATEKCLIGNGKIEKGQKGSVVAAG